MNIFVLDRNPRVAAMMLCDKHIVKMTLETAQILCSALRLNGCQDAPYKLTHKNHPCVRWAATNKENYVWLVQHGIGISEEYTKRYSKIHGSHKVLQYAATQTGHLPSGCITEFPQAMPDEYKCSDPVLAYRAYYIGSKYQIAEWKYSTKPTWFN